MQRFVGGEQTLVQLCCQSVGEGSGDWLRTLRCVCAAVLGKREEGGGAHLLGSLGVLGDHAAARLGGRKESVNFDLDFSAMIFYGYEKYPYISLNDLIKNGR